MAESHADSLSTASVQALSPVSLSSDSAFVTTGWISPIPKTRGTMRQERADIDSRQRSSHRRSSNGTGVSDAATVGGSLLAGEASSMARRRRRDAAALDIQRLWRGFCGRALVQRMTVVRRLSNPRSTSHLVNPSNRRRSSLELHVANGVTYVSSVHSALAATAPASTLGSSAGKRAGGSGGGSGSGSRSRQQSDQLTQQSNQQGRGGSGSRGPPQHGASDAAQRTRKSSADVVVNRLYKPSSRLYHDNAVEFATGHAQSGAPGFPFLRRRSQEFMDVADGRVLRSGEFDRCVFMFAMHATVVVWERGAWRLPSVSEGSTAN
jgi:hypothetical protein